MKRSFLILAVLILLAGERAKADILVYDNGPINLNSNAWNISGPSAGPYYVTDSFTVSSATNLTSAQVGIVDGAVSPPTIVDWAIGTTPFGADVSSGTSTLTDTFFGLFYATALTYESTFSLSGAVASGTTYWLTLSNTGPAYQYWDESDGPSSAQQFDNPAMPSTASESFQLYTENPSSATPEPTTLTLLGAGAVCILGLGWRRQSQPATA
jgi:hypothetical protein